MTGESQDRETFRDPVLLFLKDPGLVCLYFFLTISYLFCDDCSLCPLNPVDDRTSHIAFPLKIRS